MMRIVICLAGVMWGFASVLCAADNDAPSKYSQIPIGITAKQTALIAHLHEASETTDKLQVVLIGGLDGEAASSKAVEAQREWFAKSAPAELRQQIILHAIPNACPDGALETDAKFPPKDGFYEAAKDRELRYLWRWLGMQAPDFVIDLRATTADNSDTSLAKQLSTKAAGEMGSIPAVSIVAQNSKAQPPIDLTAILKEQNISSHSAAAKELARRRGRSAKEIASELLLTYGKDLSSVVYIPALAVVGRQRFARLTSDSAQAATVDKILQPYLKGGVSPVPKSGSDHAGHLIFAEMGLEATGKDRERWTELVLLAADQAFNEKGEPRGLAPFHNEMSDAVFMSGPILAAAGTLTGNNKYYSACVQHLEGMHKFCLREDGLYRHSPLDQAAWGRGNGFPALGTAWIISFWPKEDSRRAQTIAWQQAHLRALLKHQDRYGCWHQVVDYPASYREFTSTAMISYALWRGIREGYLERKEFEPAAKLGWQAIQSRIGPQGLLVDVCVGTGKQKSLRDYLERPASLGPDTRGGAMGLMLASEVMIHENESK